MNFLRYKVTPVSHYLELYSTDFPIVDKQPHPSFLVIKKRMTEGKVSPIVLAHARNYV